ncbi:MAG: pantetheine-phosphate adenylyltransferase [Clostridiales Family XIII bacterium]|jgi:pantetheine-phosphate adenylyltransferase|nr:pantetheine-phosphate adenylyltransferase [Clostridiales Family XIII bacterium]
MMRGTMLYAGSFDPITNGHLDIINRASGLCDKLIIGVIVNKSKVARYSFEDRKAMIALATVHIANAEIDSFDGLLADYVAARRVGAVLRGLRASMDFEYEMQMAHMNARLYKGEAETVFLMASPEFSFISSSMVNEVFGLGGDVAGLVPDGVLEYMKRRVGIHG